MHRLVSIIVGMQIGGAETMLSRLSMEIMSDPLFEHEIITLTEIGIMGENLRQNGVKIHCVDFRKWYLFPYNLWKLVQLLKVIKPDLVQTWMVHADLVGGLAAFFAGIPKIVWGVRTTDYLVESRKTRLVRFICVFLSYFIPSSIICAANRSLEECVRVGYKKQILTVIPNGFDFDDLRKSLGKGRLFRSELGLKNDDFVIGHIGRFNPAKDHANFINAAKLLVKDFTNVKFVLIGRNVTSDNSEISALVNDPNCMENIFYLLGERKDIPVCIDGMDLFVLSSRTEGFPNVLGEAMALEVPCVTTDAGDARILIGDEGKVVIPQNSEVLSRAMADLVKMPSVLREDYGKRLSNRVENEFSMSEIKRKYVQHYLSLIFGKN